MFVKHASFLGLGLVASALLMRFDYHNYLPLARVIYGVMLVILLLVAVVGKVRDGAQSDLLGIQPSEPAKLVLIITLAVWWSKRADRPSANTWVTLGGSLALASLPLALVLLQPDLGTAMVMGCIWLAMAWAAGTRWLQLLALLLATLPILWFGWLHVLKPYQKARITAFTMTESEVGQISDPQLKRHVSDVFYQTDQSLVAIGHGGLTGRGLNNGIQSQRNFLPVQYTDFIFAVAGEELGFVGTAMLLAFECLVLWHVVTIATQARDLLGRLLAAGVFALLFAHTLENAGMNMKLLPMTGIPLPFISYGGSFLVTTLCCVGLLENVVIRRRSLVF